MPAEYNPKHGHLNFPEIVVRSINLQSLVECFNNNDWEKVAYLITYAINDCEDAGAQFVAIMCQYAATNAYEAISKSAHHA